MWRQTWLARDACAHHADAGLQTRFWPSSCLFSQWLCRRLSARHRPRSTARRFWEILVRHGVLAYVCSHILAFDLQVHDGVLQILTAGAGTAHRMPEDIEYLHCIQAALDAMMVLRYQVLDTDGLRYVNGYAMALAICRQLTDSWGPFTAPDSLCRPQHRIHKRNWSSSNSAGELAGDDSWRGADAVVRPS